MCITCACADPTQPGVWWREDDRWVRYPAHLEQAILAAKFAGQHAVVLPLGQITSAKFPHGATYTINLGTMQQSNASSGYIRDVLIVPQDITATPNTSAARNNVSVIQQHNIYIPRITW